MNHSRLYIYIHTILLPVLVVILLIEAYTYYYSSTQVREIKTSENHTSLGEIINDSLPTISTPLPSAETLNTAYRVISFTEEERLTPVQIAAAQTSFIHTTRLTSISEIVIYDLQYEIIGTDGNWKPVSARVYIPATGNSSPLFVFGSGTTGMADKCAPLLENMAVENIGNYRNHMITQAAEGYVTVFPNYEGFDSPDETQAYFVSDSEAKTLLGAIKSLQQLKPSSTSLNTVDLESIFLQDTLKVVMQH